MVAKRNKKCDKIDIMGGETERRVGERRPGGRSARVRSAVLAAAVTLLEEVGYDEVTYDEIAQRAGVHKTTVYRRWPSKPELLADALELHSEEHVPVPATGSLTGDLAALAASVAANVSGPAGERRSTSIVAAASHSEELADITHRFMIRRIELTESLVAAAVERGELSADVDPRVVIEALVGPIWFRLLLTGEPIDAEFLDALVALVERGVSASFPVSTSGASRS